MRRLRTGCPPSWHADEVLSVLRTLNLAGARRLSVPTPPSWAATVRQNEPAPAGERAMGAHARLQDGDGTRAIPTGQTR